MRSGGADGVSSVTGSLLAHTDRQGLPRWLAVLLVLVGALGMFAGFVALAIPVLVTQASTFAGELPHYLRILKNHNTTLGKLNARFHIVASSAWARRSSTPSPRPPSS